jgi:hypothetical protein
MAGVRNVYGGLPAGAMVNTIPLIIHNTAPEQASTKSTTFLPIIFNRIVSITLVMLIDLIVGVNPALNFFTLSGIVTAVCRIQKDTLLY